MQFSIIFHYCTRTARPRTLGLRKESYVYTCRVIHQPTAGAPSSDLSKSRAYTWSRLVESSWHERDCQADTFTAPQKLLSWAVLGRSVPRCPAVSPCWWLRFDVKRSAVAPNTRSFSSSGNSYGRHISAYVLSYAVAWNIAWSTLRLALLLKYKHCLFHLKNTHSLDSTFNISSYCFMLSFLPSSTSRLIWG